MKIRSFGAELFPAGGQTDRQTDRLDEAKSRFSQFCERASIQEKTRVNCGLLRNTTRTARIITGRRHHLLLATQL